MGGTAPIRGGRYGLGRGATLSVDWLRKKLGGPFPIELVVAVVVMVGVGRETRRLRGIYTRLSNLPLSDDTVPSTGRRGCTHTASLLLPLLRSATTKAPSSAAEWERNDGIGNPFLV